MPSDDLSARLRKQDATFWSKTGTDSFNRPTYAAPADVKVRWTDQSIEYITQKDEKTVSKAVVFVGQDMKVGDVLRLGKVATLLPGKTPLQQPGAYEVMQFRKIPNRSAKKFLRKAVL